MRMLLGKHTPRSVMQQKRKRGIPKERQKGLLHLPETDSRLRKVKVEYELALKAMEVAKSTIEIEGARAYEL